MVWSSDEIRMPLVLDECGSLFHQDENPLLVYFGTTNGTFSRNLDEIELDVSLSDELDEMDFAGSWIRSKQYLNFES